MARFINVLAKKYDPADIDRHMFSLNFSAPHCIPLIATSKIAENGYGTATVNGIKISKGKCVKFDFSPMPIYFLPVGEVAVDFDKTYTVNLSGYRTKSGRKFADYTFKIKTSSKRTDDKKHLEADSIAKSVSDEGIILLKNNGILPLKKDSSIHLCGDYRDFRITATGASLIKPRWTVLLEEALEKNFVLTEKTNTAVLVISRPSGEGVDNKPVQGNYYLTDDEKERISDITKKYKNVILVLSTGYPIEMKFLLSCGISAIIWTGFSGQAGALSLSDILCGKVCPSGRLADTWPFDYFDSPSSLNFINRNEDSPVYSDDGKKIGAQIYYEEGQFIGYRYFDSFNKPVAFPFGHGLSYTDFEIDGNSFFDNNDLNVNINIKNIGAIAAKQAVGIYINSPEGNFLKADKILCGFDKTSLLKPEESESLSLEIPAKDFSVYDDNNQRFILEKGKYTVFAGGSICELKEIGTFELTENKIIEETISVCPPTEEVGSKNKTDLFKQHSAVVLENQKINIPAKYTKLNLEELRKHTGKRILFDDVKKDITKLDDFVSQFSLKELVRLTVCNGSCFEPWKNGAGGRLASFKKYGIPTFYMSDGNSSVNINGYTTGFPSSNLVAGTFNKNLAYNIGKVLAEESKENGISINLGPGGNIHRNFLCGRHNEYFSEDPILAGTMMAYQAKGLEENGVSATYKHLFANSIEFQRKSAHSILDERTLRELYLRVFDKAISLYKPSCIMTSYNPVNGIYPCENSELLNNLLRDEWGFDGFFMTDWGSCDTADAIKTVNAGTNLLTPGDRKLFKKVYIAAKNGEISKGNLQAGVKSILKVLLRCSL